jgi:hypothetical protein
MLANTFASKICSPPLLRV